MVWTFKSAIKLPHYKLSAYIKEDQWKSWIGSYTADTYPG